MLIANQGEKDCYGSQARTQPSSPGPDARAQSLSDGRRSISDGAHVKSLAEGRRMVMARKPPVFTQWPPLNIPRPSCKATRRGEEVGYSS
jgi:hypothetical protein